MGANIGPMGRPREKTDLPEWRQKALNMVGRCRLTLSDLR